MGATFASPFETINLATASAVGGLAGFRLTSELV